MCVCARVRACFFVCLCLRYKWTVEKILLCFSDVTLSAPLPRNFVTIENDERLPQFISYHWVLYLQALCGKVLRMEWHTTAH